VIKVTFEGKTYHDIAVTMTEYLYESRGLETAASPAAVKLEELKPKPEELKPKPKVDPHKNVAAKADAAERMAKVRAAKLAKRKPEPPPSDPRSSDEAAIEAENARIADMEPDPFDEPEPIDPTNLVALKVKTTEELQTAYSNGKHKQVMALLSKHGNGAKSFRELRIEDFVPIRKAIDDGALA